MNQEQQSNKVEPIDQGSQNLYRRPEKPRPKSQEYKPLQILDTATNQAGEVFNSGDKIRVTSPWGRKAIAEITGFYQDAGGNSWAQYTSNESLPGWTWEGGCILAALLVKA
jgi:hypothetical protein